MRMTDTRFFINDSGEFQIAWTTDDGQRHSICHRADPPRDADAIARVMQEVVPVLMKGADQYDREDAARKHSGWSCG